MLVGVGTFAGLTAAVASYFVEIESTDEHAKQLAALHGEIAALREDLRGLVEQLRATERRQ